MEVVERFEWLVGSDTGELLTNTGFYFSFRLRAQFVGCD